MIIMRCDHHHLAAVSQYDKQHFLKYLTPDPTVPHAAFAEGLRVPGRQPHIPVQLKRTAKTHAPPTAPAGAVSS
jgi:hypothetical protein